MLFVKILYVLRARLTSIYLLFAATASIIVLLASLSLRPNPNNVGDQTSVCDNEEGLALISDSLINTAGLTSSSLNALVLPTLGLVSFAIYRKLRI